MTTIADALSKLGVTNFVLRGDPTTEAEFNEMFRKVIGSDDSNTAIESTEHDIVWADVEAKRVELQAEYDAKQYARDRATEYPSIGDQLDALWKGGDDAAAMLEQVMAVKSKYPKPE